MGTKIDGNTHLFAVIGDPIAQSISPEMHNRIFEKMNANKAYMPLRIKPQDVEGAIPLLRDNFKGFNVTIPHKQEIMKYLDEIDQRAKDYGAVNTVKIENGKLKGYNTDGLGFVRSIEKEGIKLKDKRVLLLGAGGSSRVVAYELLLGGCHVTVSNRNLKRAEELKKELIKSTGNQNIDACDLEQIKKGYHYIVNATPVGTYPATEAMAISEDAIGGAELVYDLIYNPDQTKLLKAAAAGGSRTINGFPMLFYQAVKAQEIWLGQPIPEEVTAQVFEEMKSYVLKKLGK
ncbi:MAG: shikimate dehydrogenase [Thermotaleaceae bacterium]